LGAESAGTLQWRFIDSGHAPRRAQSAFAAPSMVSEIRQSAKSNEICERKQTSPVFGA
jgi:hypothetical protein